MILRALIVALLAVSVFAGVQTLQLAWARQALAEADSAAAEALVDKQTAANEIAALTRQLSTARERAARSIIRRIETGEFTNADDLIDPGLVRELDRLRFGQTEDR